MTNLKTLTAAIRARYHSLPGLMQATVIGLALGGIALVVTNLVVWIRDSRAGVRAEVGTKRERLEHLYAYVARAEPLERERELLAERLESLETRVVPGETGTLAAAHLQDHVTTVASDTGVSVQSAQVMREQEVGRYRQVTVRLTLRSTLKALADFLETIEYGPMQLSVPFLQIDGRGARARRTGRARSRDKKKENVKRMLSATLEVRGLATGGAAKPETEGKS